MTQGDPSPIGLEVSMRIWGGRVEFRGVFILPAVPVEVSPGQWGESWFRKGWRDRENRQDRASGRSMMGGRNPGHSSLSFTGLGSYRDGASLRHGDSDGPIRAASV